MCFALRFAVHGIAFIVLGLRGWIAVSELFKTKRDQREITGYFPVIDRDNKNVYAPNSTISSTFWRIFV